MLERFYRRTSYKITLTGYESELSQMFHVEQFQHSKLTMQGKGAIPEACITTKPYFSLFDE